MNTILITGAAGDIGSRLRKLLDKVYPQLRLSDLRRPADLASGESFMAADLADYAQVEKIVAGVDGIVHLGGYSVEGPWQTILNSNIVGCYNLFEAAYRAGVKRVVFASSNHAVGFYPRSERIGTGVTVRPDSRYGVSKAFGEALGAFYADKHGIRVTCLRIGNVTDVPADERRLSIWLKPEDLGTARAHRARTSQHPLRDFLRRLRQRGELVGQQQCAALRLPPAGPGRGLSHAGACGTGHAAGGPDCTTLPGRSVLQCGIRCGGAVSAKRYRTGQFDQSGWRCIISRR